MERRKLWLFIGLLTLSGCQFGDADEAELSIFTTDFDFQTGQHDWTPGFADFPANPVDSTAFELKFAYTEPIESKLSKRAVMLSGNNLNSDLFMYIKRKVGNLLPNTDYTITFHVEMTSDLNGVESMDSGSMFLKAGATGTEPKSVIERGKYVMNIDKGNEKFAGEDMITLGDLFTDSMGTYYALVTRSNTAANTRYVARTNSQGELWLIVGTDSSAEGVAKVFYTRITILFSAS